MAQDASTTRSTVTTPLAPAAIGPYSQGILVGNTLYCSGQIAFIPETGDLLSSDVEEETARALDALVYARYFNETPPARQAVEVASIPRNARVEISCIAVR